MKAALYQGKGNIELSVLPDPVCSDEGVVLQNINAGICGTDVAVYKYGTGLGHRITLGGEFGHEVICRICQVGKLNSYFKVGQRVYPYPRLVTGDPKKAGTIGGFSEYIYVPKATPGIELYPVSDAISNRAAALIEPFTVGCRAARRAFPSRKEHAIVFGAGTIGMAAAVSLKYFGCNHVMVCDYSDFRLQIAKELGFAICNNKKQNLPQEAFSYFGESLGYQGIVPDIDIYIDAAGADSVLTFYECFGKVDSRCVIVAVGAEKRTIDLLRMTFGQMALIGSGGYNPEDVLDVMKMMESKKWDIEKLVTHEYPWEQLEEAINTAADTDHALNVQINYEL